MSAVIIPFTRGRVVVIPVLSKNGTFAQLRLTIPQHIPELVRHVLERTGVPTSLPELQRMTSLTGAQVLAGLCKLDDRGQLVKCRGARYALRTPEGGGVT